LLYDRRRRLDPDYRARRNAQEAKRRKLFFAKLKSENPAAFNEWRERRNQRSEANRKRREPMISLEKKLLRQRKRYEWFKNRYHTDPEFRAKHQAIARERQRILRLLRSGEYSRIRRKRYYEGTANPKGEMQWLQKNKVELRNLKRILKPRREASISQSAESTLGNSSLP